MGRAGRGGGGFRGGGGRMGGGLGGRSGSGRMGGSSLGGRAGQGLGGIGRAPARPAARPVAPRRNPGFAAGVGVGMGMGRRRRGWGWGMGPRWGWGGGWGRRHQTVIVNNGSGPMHGGGRGGCGCFTMIFAALVAILIFIIIANFANLALPGAGGGFIRMDVTRSTVERTALPRGTANDIGSLYTDNMSPPWIGNPGLLERGMRNFFNETGVRPHLYLTGEINGSTAVPSFAQLSQFAGEVYEQLFNDEAHVLLVFFENHQGQYMMYVMPGNQARLVMDDEAREILMDYVQRYYYSNYGTEEMFSRVFDGAGTRIMTVTRSPWIPVMIVFGIVLILFLLYTWWKRKQEQKNLEAEQTERILNQSLDTFGTDDAASRLAKEYDDDNNN